MWKIRHPHVSGVPERFETFSRLSPEAVPEVEAAAAPRPDAVCHGGQVETADTLEF
jgi:hypothetical protein